MTQTIGIDIGGTGIKAAIVDVVSGELIGEKIKVGTPAGAIPGDVARVCLDLVEQLDPNGSLAVGVCFPAVIIDEVAFSASNVDQSWIGLNVGDLLEATLGRRVHVVNDADANDASAKQEMSESAVKSSPVWCRRYFNVSFLRRR